MTEEIKQSAPVVQETVSVKTVEEKAVEAAIDAPVNLSGPLGSKPVDNSINGEMPSAIPKQQIAPLAVNSDGNTSARTSPQADVPANAQVSQAGENIPSSDTSKEEKLTPPVPPAPVQPEAVAAEQPSIKDPMPPGTPEVENQEPDQSTEEEEVEPPFGDPYINENYVGEQKDPLKEAEAFVNGIPGRMRLY